MSQIKFSSYVEAREYLYALKGRGITLGFERIRGLLEKLGNPHLKYPTIHVAGTNGKGSVCAMLESIFREGGFKTGLYTSPHLVRQGERIQVRRTILSEGQILAYANELAPLALDASAKTPGEHVSFFEFMTAMGFLHFARSGVEIAVIEVGIGGRFDATNVVAPDVSCIVTIGFDHMDLLGDTLSAIAYEKAGIIKPQVPVVTGVLPRDAEVRIRAVAAEMQARVLAVGQRYPDPIYYPETNLKGSYQRHNAAVAFEAAQVVAKKFGLSEEQITKALLNVSWPGRWQKMEVDSRTIIFDASHNIDGAQCLAEHLETLTAGKTKRPIVVMGSLGAERAKALLEVIARYAGGIHLVSPEMPRALSPDDLQKLLPGTFRGNVGVDRSIKDLFPQKGRIALGNPGDTIVIAGSIYLMGEVMDQVLHGGAAQQGKLQNF